MNIQLMLFETGKIAVAIVLTISSTQSDTIIVSVKVLLKLPILNKNKVNNNRIITKMWEVSRMEGWARR